MSDPLVRGDAVSCSRVGGAMRSDAARLLHRQQTLERSLRELRGVRSSQAQALRGSVGEQARLLGQVAADLDRAGAALQRYATDLAQAMELARRAEAAVRAAGLELDGTRVVEAWGPTERQDRRATAHPAAGVPGPRRPRHLDGRPGPGHPAARRRRAGPRLRRRRVRPSGGTGASPAVLLSTGTAVTVTP